ncbi:MAG: carboxypeptidase regulatory-like domain-containing protein, partial [Vicinamibacteria bacterium]
MKNFLRNWRRAALATAILFGINGGASAQVTTGAINGVVTDESGGVLPGANITATHIPTGSRYTAVTGTDGRFNLLNVRVGGPYTVTVEMPGFKGGSRTNLMVALGADVSAPFRLAVASMTETVEVTADAGALISSTRSGPAANIAQAAIENMPTVSRSITDMARLSPHFTPVGNGAGDGPDVLSVGGRSSRYNNIQIDGANNNDLFALASNSGNPGGGTSTQPISFDAIAEIQLVVAPYDVRQGGFSGGGINAVTRSGTNQFHGTALYEFRNQKFVGDSATTFSSNTGQKIADPRAISNFSEKQATFSIGGPIVKDKAFFFINGDLSRNETPTGFSADGSSGVTYKVPKVELDRFLSILKTTYGYDPSAGGNPLGEYVRNTTSNKIFARLDFNLSDKHRLTVRNNYTKPKTDVGFPSASNFKTPDNYYQINNRSNSTVAQLNSNFGKGVNELRLSYQLIRDIRDGQGAFPSISVDLTPSVCGSSRCFVSAGRESFSGANELYQTVIELTDDYTFHK